MISRDYTKEVGIASQKKMLPRPVAYALLAAVAVGISFGVVTVLKQTKLHNAAEKAEAAPAATVAPNPTPAAAPEPAAPAKS